MIHTIGIYKIILSSAHLSPSSDHGNLPSEPTSYTGIQKLYQTFIYQKF